MIYLDNAATSYPKPESVWTEMERCMRLYGGNPGRGSHRLAMRAAEKIYECREEIAALVGSKAPENVVFTMNTTMAINTVLKGLLREGDHVLISDLEHNAVYRPIFRLAEEGRITYSVFPSLVMKPHRSAQDVCREIELRLLPNTRMLVCVHASNICSAALPLREIGALCRRRGILFVVDAAQSAGHCEVSMEEMQISALCAPGHKGLFGAQGSGFFVLERELSAATLIEGGSGVHSLEAQMPRESPERYEAGTLPTPAIAGLCEGVRTVRRISVSEIEKRERELGDLLLERLMALRGIRVIAPHLAGGVTLFYAPKISADALGAELDRREICVRTGYHCAALAHQTLGTPAGGALRASVGYYNTRAELDKLYLALREILFSV